MMSKKVLKIEIASLITSECWTYCKFAIMQTAPYFDEWLASHMSICVRHHYNSLFGELNIHPLSYFNEILQVTEENIYSVTEENVIPFFIEQIQKDNYVLVDVNQYRLFDMECTEFERHEALIYGYDTDEKVFIMAVMRDGAFRETKVSFEITRQAYVDAANHYEQDPERILARRRWFPCVAIIKLQERYQNVNAHYEFIEKLKTEVAGKVYTVTPDDDRVEQEILYTGLAAVRHSIEILQRQFSGEVEEDRQLLRTNRLICLKLYEHRIMIHRSMGWFQESIGDGCERLEMLQEQYRACCDKMQTNFLLFQKYSLNKDRNILQRIMDHMNGTLVIEKEVLREYIEIAREVYIRRKLMG